MTSAKQLVARAKRLGVWSTFEEPAPLPPRRPWVAIADRPPEPHPCATWDRLDLPSGRQAWIKEFRTP
jgi:hypothetical protein